MRLSERKPDRLAVRGLVLITLCVSAVATGGAARQRGKAPAYVSLPETGLQEMPGKYESVAIFLDGDNPVYVRLLEDALTYALARSKVIVIEPEQLGAEIASQVSKADEKPDADLLTAYKMARKAGADAVILGNVGTAVMAVERTLAEGGTSTLQTTVCSTVSLRVLDAATGERLALVLAEGAEGASLVGMAQELAARIFPKAARK